MIVKAPFGSTGHDSTRTLFGAAALSDVTQAEADRTLELLLDHGINHIDVAASYGDAELRLGPWMETRRNEFFLASKTGERSYAAARDEIRRSLERLRTDRLDLIQLHNLAEQAEWELAMGDDGALRACVEAREEGLVRFIGVTGHGLGIAAMHLRSLERFPFDTVLFPYSYVLLQDEGYRADVEALLAVCRERGVAVQTIKSLTRRPWGERGRRAPPGTSRSRSPPTSRSRCTGSWGTKASSSTPWATSTCCRGCWRPPPLRRPRLGRGHARGHRAPRDGAALHALTRRGDARQRDAARGDGWRHRGVGHGAARTAQSCARLWRRARRCRMVVAWAAAAMGSAERTGS